MRGVAPILQHGVARLLKFVMWVYRVPIPLHRTVAGVCPRAAAANAASMAQRVGANPSNGVVVRGTARVAHAVLRW